MRNGSSFFPLFYGLGHRYLLIVQPVDEPPEAPRATAVEAYARCLPVLFYAWQLGASPSGCIGQ